MEPQIRYTKTPDGVNIAYWTLGQGPVLLFMFPLPSHLQLEWQIPLYRRAYERLAARHTLVRYDVRGSGLSQHGIEWSLGGLVCDIEAVLDRLSAERCSIVALGIAGPPALSFAELHPGRIERLVLWEAYASYTDLGAQVEALTELMSRDFEMYVQAIASVAVGWEQNEDARAYAAATRAASTQEEAIGFLRTIRSFDTTPMLSGVSCPTLVVHHRDAALIPMSAMHRVAAEISDGRLVILEGSTVNEGLADEGIDIIEQFLFEGTDAPPAAGARLSSGIAIILFTDIADSTALTERMGDTAFRDASRALDEGLRAAISNAGGTAIDGKLLGDGVLATFPSAAQAIDAARRCHALSAASELRLRLGIHAGDIIREQDNVFGGAVNIASRICAFSAPGQILVSDVVRGMARSSAGVAFEDLGEQEMKGVGEPVRLYEVRWREVE